jgi:hypothetical protein
MAKNLLLDMTNTLPHMIGGRMDAHDFETLTDLPDGVLTIDLLRVAARHSGAANLDLHVVTKLVAWLDGRLAASRLARESLIQAELTVAIHTRRVPTDRTQLIPFDLECTAAFATKDKALTSKPASSLHWYNRRNGTVTE